MSADRSRSGPELSDHPPASAEPAVSPSSSTPSPPDETGTGTGTGTGDPTSDEARAALEALGADVAQLSRRFVTPWWYHVMVAAAVGLTLCLLIIPRVHPAAVIPGLVIWSPWMLHAYTRYYGTAAPHRAGRRSRQAMLLTLSVLAVLLVIAVLLKISALPSWLILFPAAASFAAVLILGRRYDATVRTEVADPDEDR